MGESSLFNQTGIQITILLMLMVIIAGLVILIFKFLSIYGRILRRKELQEARKEIEDMSSEELAAYERREKELNFQPAENQLSGTLPPADEKGVIQNINSVEDFRVFPTKRRTSSFLQYISPELSKLILYFLGTAIFWLIIGTSFGLYAGIKYVAPDVEHTSWLSFGRLRPALGLGIISDGGVFLLRCYKSE
jgi:cytochrome c oxidase cbb3-type subunit 1